jgi:Tfp pilus assembly protein PilV
MTPVLHWHQSLPKNSAIDTKRNESARRPLAQGGLHPSGVTLIEALVCLVLLSLGILGLMGLQTNLRHNADVARQRAEASRIGSQELERARNFFSISGSESWDEISNRTVNGYDLPDGRQNTTYTLVTTVTTPVNGTPRKVITVTVSWSDRTAALPQQDQAQTPNQTVTLQAIVAGVDPALSGQLAVSQISPPSSLRSGRHAAIPPSAVDLPDGRSAFKPFDRGGSVWVFSSSTGNISSICDEVNTSQQQITADVLNNSRCRTVSGLLVSGFVSGLDSPEITLNSVAMPTGQRRYWPLDDETPLQLTDAVNATSICVSDSKLTDQEKSNWRLSSTRYKQVTYYCAILLSDAASGWGGNLILIPESSSTDSNTPNPSSWAIDTTTDRYKVCRYTKYVDTTINAHKDFVSNVFHPKKYCMTTPTTPTPCPDSRVTTSIKEQNFLIIPSTSACPEYDSSTSAAGSISYNTRPHQP